MYKSTVIKIYVTELTLANTWYQVLTEEQAKCIQGYKIKSRYTVGSVPAPFDYAFTSTPASGVTTTGNGFYSNTGVGSGDEAKPGSGIFARSATAGTLIEVVVYE